jgi:NTP pyrophosphatase (non-canonical NTP hydrolase)
MSKRLANIQVNVGRMYQARGYTNDLLTLALGLCEEAGEVAKAVNTYYNPLYKPTPGKPLTGDLQEELKDVMIYLLAIADAAGIDMEDIMEQKLKEFE